MTGVQWCSTQAWWIVAKFGLDNGFVVEVHVAPGSIPTHVITPERLDQGHRAVVVSTKRDPHGVLVVLECPRTQHGFHIRMDPLAARLETSETLVAAMLDANLTSTPDSDWN